MWKSYCMLCVSMNVCVPFSLWWMCNEVAEASIQQFSIYELLTLERRGLNVTSWNISASLTPSPAPLCIVPPKASHAKHMVRPEIQAHVEASSTTALHHSFASGSPCTVVYSQRVEGAQTLEGIRGQLWYLVVTQVSVTIRERRGGREKQRSTQATDRTRRERPCDIYLLIYSHPAQLLIRREGPSWDHLDGVLLQSSGTKHTHRPLRSDINIPPSRSYRCCISDSSFPGALAWGNISR